MLSDTLLVNRVLRRVENVAVQPCDGRTARPGDSGDSDASPRTNHDCSGKPMMKRFFDSILLVAVCWTATGSMTPCSAQDGVLDVREGTGIPAEVYTIYEKGANFLAATQRDDGTWGVGVQRHGSEVNGICSLCVMAFLSTGEDPNFGKYAGNIRKALQHIILDQDPKTGYIQGNMYVHGFSMLALAECYGAVDDELLWAGEKDNKKKRTIAEALELAVRLAVTCLLYTSPSPRDLSTSRMPSSA